VYKRQLWIFAVMLISSAGIFTYCYLNWQSITNQNSRASAESRGILPEGWDDRGIFSACYDKAYLKMSSMSLEEKVGQMFLAHCPGENAAASIRNDHLGGFVLFEADFQNKTADEVISAIKSYQEASAVPMLMAVDEEGGKVVRISGNPLLAKKKFQSPRAVYASGGLNAVRADAKEKAALLKTLGLNVNLAPVADVSTNSRDYIYGRTLGKSAQETGEYVAAVVRATREAGLSSSLKHFPGYGDNADTHKRISVDKRPYSTFEKSDFIPFEEGISAGAESVMVSHNIVECMDKGVPASLSDAVHKILRDDLRFTGVIMTDSLSMEAIKDYTGNRDPSVQAVLAGNDMLLTAEFQQGYDSVLAAAQSGEIPKQTIDKAVFRILAWKYAKGIIK
jgi:beta-N-acetylhexosaminidase